MLTAIIDKFRYTWSLMGASWTVLRHDKELILFPLLSGICCILVVASFAVPVFMTGAYEPPAQDAPVAEHVVYYGLIFLFYVANYFVITFFNTAIIAAAIHRMQGGDPTVAWGFNEAMKRIHLILGWALVAATVGLLLRVLEERSGKVGKVVSAIGGVAWTLVTFLVVPVLVMQNKGPLAAAKESGKLLRRTWGEQVVGNFSFGMVFFVINLPAIAAVFGGIALFVGGNSVAGGILIGLAIVYLLIAGLVQSALQSIFQAAVYLYATDPPLLEQGQASGHGFPVLLLRDAVVHKTGN